MASDFWTFGGKLAQIGRYSGGSTTIGKEKKRGLLRRTSEAQWKKQMGG
jgi:hypothetical protein